jgi:hypothetical protein
MSRARSPAARGPLNAPFFPIDSPLALRIHSLVRWLTLRVLPRVNSDHESHHTKAVIIIVLPGAASVAERAIAVCGIVGLATPILTSS